MNQPAEKSEIGRQLRADELREMTVVCLRREDRDITATWWVESINSRAVVFLAGATWPRIHFMAFRQADGTLVDDTGKLMLVFEYLGEV